MGRDAVAMALIATTLAVSLGSARVANAHLILALAALRLAMGEGVAPTVLPHELAAEGL